MRCVQDAYTYDQQRQYVSCRAVDGDWKMAISNVCDDDSRSSIICGASPCSSIQL